MKEVLDRLRDKIVLLKERAFFNPPATEEEIRDVEKKLKIEFSVSLREFYLVFNGGFFAEKDWELNDLKNVSQYETIQWNSNTIMSLEDIKSGFGSRYPGCVPIIHTHSQEFLAIINPLVGGESPIFDAFHEYPPQEWGILYKNFKELLIDYIDKEGNINTIAG